MIIPLFIRSSFRLSRPCEERRVSFSSYWAVATFVSHQLRRLCSLSFSFRGPVFSLSETGWLRFWSLFSDFACFSHRARRLCSLSFSFLGCFQLRTGWVAVSKYQFWLRFLLVTDYDAFIHCVISFLNLSVNAFPFRNDCAVGPDESARVVYSLWFSNLAAQGACRYTEVSQANFLVTK